MAVDTKRKQSLYDPEALQTMLRQAKEADMPFFQDYNDGSNSDDSFKSDNQSLDPMDDISKDSQSDKEEEKQPEQLDADGNESDHSSLISSSNSDDDEYLDSKDDINHPENKPGLQKAKTLARRATIFAGNFNPESGEEIKTYTKSSNDLKRS